jgi:outer membrane protein, multidrug efflux system
MATMRIPSRVLWIGLCSALGACASAGPDYRAPELRTPAFWHATDAARPHGSLIAWWRQFGDPDLVGLEEAALQGSPDVRSALARLREARARFGVADAARYPAFDHSASAERTEYGGTGVDEDTFTSYFDASWEVDIFGGTRRAVEAARANAEAAVAGVREARVSLVAEVARTYVDLRTQQQRLQIARQNLSSLEETRQLIYWRAQAGLVTHLDVLQADSTLEQDRSRIPPLASGVESDLNKLVVLSGLSRAQLDARILHSVGIPQAPSAMGLTIPAETLRQRPDVRMAERKLAAQTAEIGVAEADRYPALSLSGSIGLSASSGADLLKPSAGAGILLGGLTTPLFDAGRIRQNIAVQNALQEQALIAYEKTVAQALADVESALVALSRSRERVANLAAARQSAQLAAQLARQQYAAGLIDYFSVQSTQRTLLTVEDSLASAEGDRATALVQLYKSLGGGFAPSPQSGSVPQ